MSLFATNLPLIRKIVEQLWREITRQAGDASMLNIERARVEVTIKVIPVRKMPEHFIPPAVDIKYLRANTAARLYKNKPPRMGGPRGKVETLWKRLMGADD